MTIEPATDAPAPPPPGRARGRRGRPDATELPPIREADYVNPTPEQAAQLSREIDDYFNTPLHMFPYAESRRKPQRFHVFLEQSIAERFPRDEDIRGEISHFGRAFFRSLVAYVLGKRLMMVMAMGAVAALAAEGPALFAAFGLTGLAPVAVTLLAMALVWPVFAGVNALVFIQYRINLENRCYALSRQIIQRTRELQNVYARLKAEPDQEETRFQNDGKGWGERSAFLIRMVMWVAQRMDFLERFVQVEMWRLRRERYWINWFGGLLVAVITLADLALLALEQPPAAMPGGEAMFRILQVAAALIGLALAWTSYHFWKTPLNLAQDKLGADGWVRYATLDLDNAIGDQISRDKGRLVEYRTLNKGR